jgi:hypothetical protein
VHEKVWVDLSLVPAPPAIELVVVKSVEHAAPPPPDVPAISHVGVFQTPLVHVATSEAVPVSHENVYVDPSSVFAPPAIELVVVKSVEHAVPGMLPASRRRPTGLAAPPSSPDASCKKIERVRKIIDVLILIMIGCG